MRRAFGPQLRLDCPAVSEVRLNTDCRDEIIPILRALRHIHGRPELRDELLDAVAHDVDGSTRADQGPRGMDCWSIPVLGAVRPGCDFDYDRLQDLAEEPRSPRRIMGIDGRCDDRTSDWRCLRDSISLPSPDTIGRPNHRVVAGGHRLIPDAAHTARGDSFVVAADIHSPTDSGPIGDGLRTVIRTSRRPAGLLGQVGWRQHGHLRQLVKAHLRTINRIAAGKGRDFLKRLRAAYRDLLDVADRIITRAGELLDPALIAIGLGPAAKAVETLGTQWLDFPKMTIHARDQARRRVLAEETVANGEKPFSLLEPEAQLIKRGKVPRPVEFGHRVLIVEDGAGFVCHYAVLPRGAEDREVVVGEMKQVRRRLDGQIRGAWFDRGSHWPEDQVGLAELVAQPCLPKPGHGQAAERAREATVEFREARRRHAGVESAIGALQPGNGQDRCRDPRFGGYCRHVGPGVLGRNLHVLGEVPISREDPKCVAGQSRRGRKVA